MNTTTHENAVAVPTVEVLPLGEAIVERAESPTDDEQMPGVVIHLCIDGAETIYRDSVTGTLLAQSVRRVHTEASGDDIAFLIVWNEGREHEFAQASLAEGWVFNAEVHDGSTPAGHCLRTTNVGVDAVIANLRTWLAGGPIDPSLGWEVARWNG